MVLHALEMEEEEADEETESLLHEVNNSGGGGDGRSLQRSNSIASDDAASSTQQQRSVRSMTGHGNGGTGSSSSNNNNSSIRTNGRATTSNTSNHSLPSVVKKTVSSSVPSKLITVVFALAALGAIVFLFLLSGGSSEALLKPSDDVEDHGSVHNNISGPGPDHGDSTPPDKTPAKETGNETKTGDSNKKAFVYSNLATIIPDPDHVPIDDETKTKLEQRYGKWHFWDGDENGRPTSDYCAAYPNRDIPGDEFPDSAWQIDAVFVNHLLNDAEQLISRAMEAIFDEYGHGKPLPPEGLAERMKMFHWYRVVISGEGKVELPEKFSKKGSHGAGGWTTERSVNGLVKRLLHAMMTNDTFTVVLAGHSAAAGHGNHFRQSYMMQFHKIMAPIFARLGVKLVTRNLSQGGLGTLHNSIGMASLYGDEIDLILWDSGMTETNAGHIDLFLRQALLSGNRVPVIWGGWPNLLGMLHQMVDADIGVWGSGFDGVPVTESEEQVLTLPYAARYMWCGHDQRDLCKDEPVFCTHCWIDRPDLNPAELFDKIDEKPGGQVKWHPGWRVHQLTGRVLAFAILDALQVAIEIWSDGTMGGPPLDDEWWHVTDYYENIRTKVKNLSPELGDCEKIAPDLPKRLCYTKMQARSFFTPRANPALTSLSTLFKPSPDGYVPHNEEKEMYHGPDVHNKCYDLPPDAVDVVAIVSGRRRLTDSGEWIAAKKTHRAWDEEPYHPIVQSTTNVTLKTLPEGEKLASRRISKDEIFTGKGWQVVSEKVGECDGTYYAICGRERSNSCPLIGHHDSRGSVVGNEYAGWLVMDLPNVKEGIIMLKIVTYLDEKSNTRTAGWTTVNNERLLHTEDREWTNAETIDNETHEQGRRRTSVDDLPDDFFFDYAIDGKITSLSKEQFKQLLKKPQRVVEILTLLDDPNFTNTARNVELAIRMRNCGRQCTFAISHAYWA